MINDNLLETFIKEAVKMIYLRESNKVSGETVNVYRCCGDIIRIDLYPSLMTREELQELAKE